MVDPDAPDGDLSKAEDAGGRVFDPDAEKLVYEMEGWTADLQSAFCDLLGRRGIPYEFDAAGDLVVGAVDEEAADSALDAFLGEAEEHKELDRRSGDQRITAGEQQSNGQQESPSPKQLRKGAWAIAIFFLVLAIGQNACDDQRGNSLTQYEMPQLEEADIDASVERLRISNMASGMGLTDSELRCVVTTFFDPSKWESGEVLALQVRQLLSRDALALMPGKSISDRPPKAIVTRWVAAFDACTDLREFLGNTWALSDGLSPDWVTCITEELSDEALAAAFFGETVFNYEDDVAQLELEIEAITDSVCPVPPLP